MKNQKRQSVSAVSCPECKMGTAVNKREAYHAFHSKRYSKRRKALRPAAQQRTPQVGRDTNIEYVLIDPSFAERVAPPKLLNEDDGFFPKIILWGVAIITFPIAIAYGFDLYLWKVGLLLFAILVIYIAAKLDLAQLRSDFARRRQYEQTWLCLSCGYQWIDTKDNARKL
jgi:hypothetical protein